MRELTRRVRGLVHDERGANAVLIAMLLVPMMGFGALALDVSAQHAERTQLQHGADAAAMAVARECAADESICNGSAAAVGNAYIGDNGGTPVAGAAEIESLDLDDNLVTLAASAEFPHFFASLIDSDADPYHTTVRARATAEWGTPEGGATIPLAVAECELERHFDPGTETAGDPFILRLIGPGGGARLPDDCAPGYPGGFGWLEGDDIDGDGDADCEVIVEVGVPEAGDPGRSDTGAGGCESNYIIDLLGTTILIPIYDAYTPGSGGADGSYNISRFAAFYMTGYKVASAPCDQVSHAGACYMPGETNAPGFIGGEFGIQGYFVRYVEIGEDFDLGDGGGEDGGLVVVRLID
jgi:hypothetical protein